MWKIHNLCYTTQKITQFTTNIVFLCGHLSFYEQMTVGIALNGTQMNVADNSFERYRNVKWRRHVRCICLLTVNCIFLILNVIVAIQKCTCTNCKWMYSPTHLKDTRMLMALPPSNEPLKSLSNCQIVNLPPTLFLLGNNSVSRGINPNFWSPIQFQRSQNDLKPRKSRMRNHIFNINIKIKIKIKPS